jgi:NAD(P)-dependent dehydrogenase (short-subunit alcohol dehydrogenase family)
MKRGSGGSIINIASVNAVKACVFDNIHYGAAKAAVNNITISIALEYGSYNIRANSIMPGSIATENAIKSAVGNPPHGPITKGDRIPLRRRGQPADVAAACLFLASEASSYVTGQLIAVDGGFLIG